MQATTAERLRAATEDLLIERGHHYVTLRDITTRAEANVAAVGYHFGSKDALVAEVYRTALREATERQRQLLEQLPEGAPLEDVVRVWLAPALHAPDIDPRLQRWWQLITRGMAEQAPALLEAVPDVHTAVDDHLIGRLAAALPHLSRAELHLRHDLVLRAVAALAPADGLPGAPGPVYLADMLVTWIVGGLRAPATYA